MSETKWTPGPWRWQGEDYRYGWGWQILVGPSSEGLIVGQDVGGGPCKHLKTFMPVDPELCISGLMAEGKPRVQSVHVFSEANARLIASAPDLYEALNQIQWGLSLWDPESGENGSQYDECPMCGHSAARGHAPDCCVGAALAKARGEA